MAAQRNIITQYKKTGKKAVRNAAYSPIVEITARLGYAARGLIYSVIGVLAILLAMGYGGGTTDQQGAIAAIGNQWAGQFLLGVVLIGLICYTLWGLIRAVLDPLHKGNEIKGMAIRVGYLFSGIAYSFLVMPTFALMTGGPDPAHNGAQGEQTRHYTGRLLAESWGQWLVGLAGVIVIIVGLFQIFQGLKKSFERELHLAKLTPSQVHKVKTLGRFGTVSRGIVFGLVGIFLIIAAYKARSSEAKGFDGVLMSIMDRPYGSWFIGCIALGLVAMGFYSLLVAAYLRLTK